MPTAARLSSVEGSTGTRMEPNSQLTDEQWRLISDLFTNPDANPAGGRPRVAPRDCVEGILWVLRTGARWRDLPGCFPSPATCWRRLKQWTEDDVWDKAWGRLLRKLDRQGKVDREESMADATFSSAKKGVNTSARQNLAKEPRPWFLSTETDCHLVARFPQPAETTFG